MFEPLNELERALVAAFENQNNRPAFLRLLVQSDLYFSPQGPQPADGSLGPIASATTPDDPTPAAAFFTAPERVKEALGAEALVGKANGLDLLRRIRGNSMKLNPNLYYFANFKPADIETTLSFAPQKFT
jgi:hypothetical protein